MARNKPSSTDDGFSLPPLQNWRDAAERGAQLNLVGEKLRRGEISPRTAREFRLSLKLLADEAAVCGRAEQAARARAAAQRGHVAATKRLAEAVDE